MDQPLFQSFFLGGFECSCHRTGSGRRLDVLDATCHPQYALVDFQRLRQQGMTTARSGIRWHLIETRPYHYDFASVLPLIHAAKSTGIQVIWDLCHYGWPDDLDIFSTEFVRRFARLTDAFIRLLTSETEATPFLTPINEMSFLSWVGGDVGHMYPYAYGRGVELKAQLVRATIESIEAIWQVAPSARIAVVEPLIHIAPHPHYPDEDHEVEAYRMAQYQAWDMVAGRIFSALGGQEKYLDLIGINYYPNNQWMHKGPTLEPGHPLYKPFHQMLAEVYARYKRPLFIAETGTEGDARPGWLRYISGEVRAAIHNDVPVEGICLYPILDHPGWDNDRYCPNGLWGYADERGERVINQPYAAELQRQQHLFAAMNRKRQLARTAAVAAAKQNAARPAICLFTDSWEPSGLGEHMLTLAAELLRRFQILFVCPPTARGRRILDRAEQVGCTPLALPLGDELRSYQLLATWLRQLDVQIFHCHAGIGWEGHNGVHTARTSGVPVVIRTEHLPYLLTDAGQQAAYQRLFALVDHFIFVSAEARRTHLAAGVPKAKASLVRNGILTPRIKPSGQAVRQEFGLPAEAKLVFTPARLTEQKGHRFLVDAMPTILAAEPNTYFLWAGDGPEELALRQQIAGLALDPARILFLGWRTDIPRLLAESDLFVLPSLFEGLPLVALEALALGTPVIGTCVCGTSEAIEDGVSGHLVQPGDSAALATAIVDALSQPGVRKQWAEAGRVRFEQHFTAERMGCETAMLYDALLAHSGESFNASTDRRRTAEIIQVYQ